MHVEVEIETGLWWQSERILLKVHFDHTVPLRSMVATTYRLVYIISQSSTVTAKCLYSSTQDGSRTG